MEALLTRETMMKTFTVQQSFLGLLYEDGAFIRVLNPGKHRLSPWPLSRVERWVDVIDMRELRAMAEEGARFVVGVDGGDLGGLRRVD